VAPSSIEKQLELERSRADLYKAKLDKLKVLENERKIRESLPHRFLHPRYAFQEEFIAEHDKKGVQRKLEIKFLLAPIEIKGKAKVEEIVFAINEVKDGKVIATDKSFTIKAGLVVTAIGYDAVEYPGINIENGRITNIAGHVEHNIYVTGWAKRGPVGVIGTNKSDSNDVVELIISNLTEPKVSEGISSLLKSGHEVIDQVSWEKINASEVISGDIVGKPRIKEVDWKRLISLGRS
jgi:ferredoxin--NADP+ reductase